MSEYYRGGSLVDPSYTIFAAARAETTADYVLLTTQQSDSSNKTYQYLSPVSSSLSNVPLEGDERTVLQVLAILERTPNNLFYQYKGPEGRSLDTAWASGVAGLYVNEYRERSPNPYIDITSAELEALELQTSAFYNALDDSRGWPRSTVSFVSEYAYTTQKPVLLNKTVPDYSSSSNNTIKMSNFASQNNDGVTAAQITQAQNTLMNRENVGSNEGRFVLV